jgi:hypothetical protein
MSGISEAYCVKPGEFAALFSSLEVLLDTIDGDRSIFIGRKRA